MVEKLQALVPYAIVVGGVVLAVKYSFWVLLGVAAYVGYKGYQFYKNR